MANANWIYWAFAGGLTFSFQAGAQNVYKCGNTYSQSPCATDAAVVSLQPNGTANLGSANRIKDTATPEQQASQEALCLAGVRASLKDPESARFSGVTRNGMFDGVVPGVDGPAMKHVSYSGHVNAKNSYGGYVGDKLFFCSRRAAGTKVLDTHILK